ncbi:MAG: leucine-rich repeat protein [Clostridia bacterium]|nr:leucine-rich repeat protein [Clostridia bacterium]
MKLNKSQILNAKRKMLNANVLTKREHIPHLTNEISGITLIALVITVIVLLILAGVAISLGVSGDGLFAKTNNTVTKWNAKVGEEQNEINNVLKSLDKQIYGYDPVEGDPTDWIVDEDKLVKYIGNKTDLVVIPNMLNGVFMNTIMGGVFSGRTDIQAIEISNGIKTIGNGAFAGQNNLKGSLIIPDSVTTIEAGAFYNCSGFNGTLNLGNGVKTIGGSAFYGCSGFTGDLTIPESVTEIVNTAFSGCSGFNGNLTINANIDELNANNIFGGSKNFAGNLVIGGGVKKIANDSFKYWSNFKGTLTIEEGVTTIGNNAFDNCYGLTGGLTIPKSVKTVGENAFNYCTGLTGNVIIEGNTETIAAYAFRSLQGLTGKIETVEKVGTIHQTAFSDTKKISELKLNASDIKIDESIFDSAPNLEYVQLQGDTISIGNRAFSGGKSLKNVEINASNILNGGVSAFDSCSELETVNIYGGDMTFKGQEFYYCQKLKSFYIEGKKIDMSNATNGVFRVCQSLETGTIKGDEVLLGFNTVSSNYYIKNLTITGKTISLKHDSFYQNGYNPSYTSFGGGLMNAITFNGKVSINENGPMVGVYSNKLVFNGDVEVFQYLSSNMIKEIEFNGSIGEIVASDNGYFDNGLEKIKLPTNISEIPTKFFYQCNNLREVTYTGTKSQWNEMNKNTGNDYLSQATIHCSDGDILPNT